MYGAPIGYAYNGDIYCEPCLCFSSIPDKDEAVVTLTDAEEVDSPIHCGVCGKFLGGNLLNRGVTELEEQMRNARVSLAVAWEYMDHWDWADWAVFEHFYGAFDLLGEFHGEFAN